MVYYLLRYSLTFICIHFSGRFLVFMILSFTMISGVWVINRWPVGCTSCTLQAWYAWLMRGFGIGVVGILIYRVLRLSLRCDSWHASYAINLVK